VPSARQCEVRGDQVVRSLDQDMGTQAGAMPGTTTVKDRIACAASGASGAFPYARMEYGV
jgi:hypothetical protein